MRKSLIWILIPLLVSMGAMQAQDSNRVNKPILSLQCNLNATLDKNIVTRGLVISGNRMMFQNHFVRLEPVVNYRYGYVTPKGRPTQKLENDFFTQVETHFLPYRKLGLSLMGGYENSPHLRLLQQRWWAGAGPGTTISGPKYHVNFALYGLTEESVFAGSRYIAYRLAPSIKGRVHSKNNRSGLVYTVLFAQDVTKSSNYRFRAFAKPYLRITEHIDLNIMYEIWWENIVDGSSPQEISTLTLGLSFSR